MMTKFNIVFFCLTCASVTLVNAQNATTTKCTSLLSYMLTERGDTINKLDCKGMKQGYWVEKVTGRDFVEISIRNIGEYVDGNKVGLWQEFEGDQLVATNNYNLKSKTTSSQYFANGQLACEGSYRIVSNTSAFDTFEVYNPRTGYDTTVAVRAARGILKNGLWKFYDSETGNLVFTREYWLDELIEHKDIPQQPTLTDEQRQQIEARMPHSGGRVFAPMQNRRRLPKPPTIGEMRSRL